MISEKDDHIPAPAGPRAKKEGVAATAAKRILGLAWGDRILFTAFGILLGFAAAYVYLERAGRGAAPSPADPHAGVAGVQPGATRDLPGSGGGAPGISMDPTVQKGLSDLQAAVTRDPKNGDLLVHLGNAAYDAGDWRLAVDSYERALKIKGDDPNVLTDLGVAYRNLGDSDKALARFDRALTLDPKHWQALYNKTVVLGLDKGQTGQAKELIAKLKATGQNAAGVDQLEKSIDQASGR
ncbi:MAG: tetratricopeptide repeat protein [Thermoanaerobaculia bacterium]